MTEGRNKKGETEMNVVVKKALWYFVEKPFNGPELTFDSAKQNESPSSHV